MSDARWFINKYEDGRLALSTKQYPTYGAAPRSTSERPLTMRNASEIIGWLMADVERRRRIAEGDKDNDPALIGLHRTESRR